MKDTPICLSASVELARGNGGLDVDLGAMQSTSRHWLKIEELRIFIDPGQAELTSDKAQVDLGFLVDVAIAVGKDELTSGYIGTPAHPTGERIAFVPAYLIGPRIWRRFSTINANNAIFGVNDEYTNQNAYTWTLPRPMLVPPNTPVRFKVRRTSSVALLDAAAQYPDSFTVEVAAVGLKLASKPRDTSRFIPHIHGWSPRNANSVNVESGEAFRNLHKQPLHLTWLIAGTAVNFGLSVEPDGFTALRTLVDPTSIIVSDAHGQDVIAPLTPVPLNPANPSAAVSITSLMLAKTNSLRISDKLALNQAYRVVVSPVAAQDAGYNGTGILYLPMVGIESFREVPL